MCLLKCGYVEYRFIISIGLIVTSDPISGTLVSKHHGNYLKMTLRVTFSAKKQLMMTQGGPRPVVNGVITSLSGVIRGNWGNNPYKWSQNPAYNWSSPKFRSAFR